MIGTEIDQAIDKINKDLGAELAAPADRAESG